MKIISRRQRREVVTYHRVFDRRALPGSGFSFDCDKDGNVDVAALNPCAQDSWKLVTTHPEDYEDLGAEERINRWTEPSVGECEKCGEQVSLYGFTNTCECGADYNMSGQRLAPRSQWGEETGENVSDILRIDSMSVDQCFDGDDY